MDFQLTGQQRRMVAAVRELAQGEFKASAQRYMDGTFPWENMKKLAGIGVLGMSVPEDYGGPRLPGFATPPLPAGGAQTPLRSPRGPPPGGRGEDRRRAPRTR